MPLTCIGELSLAGNSSRNHIGMARNSSRNRRSNRSNGNDATMPDESFQKGTQNRECHGNATSMLNGRCI